jgi:multidrug efflux pump subunit AcrB
MAAAVTINTLTMFGMVLAIGLLVDDAIVVVENVERLMHRAPQPHRSHAQIDGRDFRRADRHRLVLAAVFLPMAFFGGSTGVIYRQFSITIVSAMALSVLVALVLTPRCAPRSSSRTSPRTRKAMGRWPASSAGSTPSSMPARALRRACAPPCATGSARWWSMP